MTLFDHHWVKVFRQEAMGVQHSRCCYCRSRLSAKEATADHRTARSRGGKSTRANIAVACYACNKTKGSMTEGAFMAAIKKPPTADASFYLQLAWMRRKVNLRAERVDVLQSWLDSEQWNV